MEQATENAEDEEADDDKTAFHDLFSYSVPQPCSQQGAACRASQREQQGFGAESTQ